MTPLLLIALVLSVNNFGVALAMGGIGLKQQRLRIGLIFGVFEFAMPLLGMLAGRAAAERLLPVANWAAPALIAALGLWTLASPLPQDSSDDAELRRRTGSTGALLLFALGLSLDNLAIGFAIGTRGFDPLLTAAVIAATVFVFVQVGLALGTVARRHWQRWARVGSGILLLLLAVSMAVGWL